MALTDAQQLDVVRWAGYSRGGDDYDNVIEQLDLLNASEETALVDKFLTPLETMEAALLAAADNLDTKSAGPWTANDREVAQRTALYNQVRRGMVAFLGFEPGPALGNGTLRIVRC
jgi:hypothetical protein